LARTQSAGTVAVNVPSRLSTMFAVRSQLLTLSASG
jgi:hypothetical protein